jgi:hypothetical protein
MAAAGGVLMDATAAVNAMRSAAISLRALSRVPAQAAEDASRELEAVLREQHGEEVDPYGNPWAPLAESTIKRKGGDTRILRRTDTMLDELSIRPSPGAGLTLTFGAPYAAFHQVGTKDMPARRLLPIAAMPKTWSDAIKRALDARFQKWADGAGPIANGGARG